MTKHCPKCKNEKDISLFTKQQRTKDGLYYCCKDCCRIFYNSKRDKEKGKIWREKNKALIRERSKVYNELNRGEINRKAKEYHRTIKGKITEYKHSAKKRGIPFLLLPEEFAAFWQQPCGYCGAPIETIGIDRVDGGKSSYIKSNCISCCYTCNIAKSDMSLNEFKVWLKTTYKRLCHD